MKVNVQSRNWMVDAVLFVGFLLAFLLDLTGLELHQWLGVALGAGAFYHLVVHWSWVKAVTRRFFGRTSSEARVYYVTDVGLTVGFLIMLVTGLVISTWFDLPLQDYTLWRDVHVLSSIATLALTVLKIGAHWKWIVCVGKRCVFPPVAATPAAPTVAAGKVKLAPASAQATRRDFLKLMGVVGVASFFASHRAIEALVGAQPGGAQVAQAAPEPAPTAAPAAPTAPAPVTPTAAAAAPTATVQPPIGSASLPSSLAQPTTTPPATAVPQTTGPTAAVVPTASIAPTKAAATACVVRCSKGCSYPGQCRKYVDANKNGRCDLGECL